MNLIIPQDFLKTIFDIDKELDLRGKKESELNSEEVSIMKVFLREVKNNTYKVDNEQ